MIDTNEISKFLTPELCEDAGIIVIAIGEETLDLGAMNLDYIKVKKVIKTIESEYNLKVSLKQITSLEWETWFENNHDTSVEKIQKNRRKSFSKNDPNVFSCIQDDSEVVSDSRGMFLTLFDRLGLLTLLV